MNHGTDLDTDLSDLTQTLLDSNKKGVLKAQQHDTKSDQKLHQSERKLQKLVSKMLGCKK
ncbi:MAG: hypothetical protein PHG16_07050 [Lachnospiraceae bacterium]|nr:hypothetical protein [Lachnospiraceae bacterium]